MPAYRYRPRRKSYRSVFGSWLKAAGFTVLTNWNFDIHGTGVLEVQVQFNCFSVLEGAR